MNEENQTLFTAWDLEKNLSSLPGLKRVIHGLHDMLDATEVSKFTGARESKSPRLSYSGSSAN